MCLLITGDIILSCNGNIVTRMYDLNVHYAAESVNLVSVHLRLALTAANFEEGTRDGCYGSYDLG